MTVILGRIIVIVGLSLVCYDVIRGKEVNSYRLYALSALMLAFGFVGYLIISVDSTTEADFGKLGSLHKVVTQATGDAQAISSVKALVDSQSATISLVADRAQESFNLSKASEAQLSAIERRSADLSELIQNAKQDLSSLKKQIMFSNEVLAANSDDRAAFDRIKTRAGFPSGPFYAQAIATLLAVVNAHNGPFGNQFPSNWADGKTPDKLPFNDLVDIYESETIPTFRLSELQYINGRANISMLKKAAFNIHVIETSQSINAVEIAGRYLDGAAGTSFAPLNVEAFEEWWKPTTNKYAAHLKLLGQKKLAVQQLVIVPVP